MLTKHFKLRPNIFNFFANVIFFLDGQYNLFQFYLYTCEPFFLLNIVIHFTIIKINFKKN